MVQTPMVVPEPMAVAAMVLAAVHLLRLRPATKKSSEFLFFLELRYPMSSRPAK